AIYGVPVAGKPFVDRRPSAGALSLALGHHDDDLLAAFASAPQATLEQRRATERLLAAFTAQKINRLASADGLVELEEFEHAAAFQSLPGGSAGTDRFLQRVQTGGVGGLKVGRQRGGRSPRTTVKSQNATSSRGRGPAMAGGAGGGVQDISSEMLFSIKQKPTLIQATEMMINDIAR